jgi:Ca2+-binding EF-hand superfamily protein
MSTLGAPELTAWADAFFHLLDADGDGVIGRHEYRNLMLSVSIEGAVADESFRRLDLDGDGQLSRSEFTQLYLEFFSSDDPEAPGSCFWGPF